MTLERDLEFLYEMGALRFVKRTWVQFLSPTLENNSEHLFRVTWIALVLARMEGVKDLGKVARMALVHDIAESRTGDVHYVSREFTQRFEEKAIKEMVKETSLEDIELVWKEYHDRQSLESKIVKDADNLAVDFELHEQEAMGSTLKKNFKSMREKVAQTKLFTDSAKRMWAAIQTSNPHAWHLNSTNRLNSGDWKK
ncbi:MAG: HD domain-containing protein [Candidatus Diapherotrites archaeon]|nr:HD domain-containing protein [Candidatus Diapherotrites archaeon]